MLFSSEIDFTIKLGAFPIYVIAPKKTAPIEIAKRVLLKSVINTSALPPAVLKNTKYVGVLVNPKEDELNILEM